MKAKDFVEKAKLAASLRTVYMKGVWGQPVTAQTIAEKQKQYPTWYKKSKVEMLMNLVDFKYFGFDCVCLIKAILWGWNADYAHKNGGAVYKSNGVPDLTADSMFDVCTEKSMDFTKIAVGEAVWMKGHIGIYIGDGLAVEATSKWQNNVQITACNCVKEGYNSRTWAMHGKLPYVEYEAEGDKIVEIIIEKTVLKKGAKDGEVKLLQNLLNLHGANLEIDGSFGKKTDEAVREYQKKNGLDVDGSVGRKTWASLLSRKNYV